MECAGQNGRRRVGGNENVVVGRHLRGRLLPKQSPIRRWGFSSLLPEFTLSDANVRLAMTMG